MSVFNSQIRPFNMLFPIRQNDFKKIQSLVSESEHLYMKCQKVDLILLTGLSDVQEPDLVIKNFSYKSTKGISEYLYTYMKALWRNYVLYSFCLEFNSFSFCFFCLSSKIVRTFLVLYFDLCLFECLGDSTNFFGFKVGEYFSKFQ